MTTTALSSLNGQATKPTPWSLDDLFPALDAPAVVEAQNGLKDAVVAFEQKRDLLSSDIESGTFIELLHDYEQLQRLVSRLYGFIHLTFAENTQNQKAQTALAQMRQLMAEMGNRTLFFSIWWKELEEEDAARLMSNAGGYRYFLEELRKERPHTLTETQEQIVNLKNVNGRQALNTLYSTITNRYVYEMEVDGDVKEMTREQLMGYAFNPRPDLRERAYQTLLAKYEADAPILGQIYQSIVRDWRSEHVGLRHYDSPIAVRNLSNDVPDEAVDTLLEVCRENAVLFQRYFRLKARWLGVEKMRRYDVYAAISPAEKEYEYRRAVELVLDSFQEFDPDFAVLARRVFAEKHIDSEVRQGKQGGAFCASILPEMTPWVLQSYTGKPNDVATMAHELGHAIHAMLSSKHNALVWRSSLPLAETASTFSEMLLVDKLLELTDDPEVQRDLLFQQMDDAYGTILRQAFFAMFEREAHEAIHQGASVDEISELYLTRLREQFGDAIEVSDDFKSEWVAIPHFYHTPFYVYAYAFGQLLVLSLYRQYQEEGDAFIPGYRAILEAGGSDAPEAILEQAGIDIYDSAFWQGGFDVLADLVEQLEALPLPEQA